jgi:FtsH-binding integral membrane protein
MEDIDRTAPYSSVADPALQAVDPKLRAFMMGVYNKVALGLLLSAIVAYLTSSFAPIRDLLFRTASVDGVAHLVGLTGAGTVAVFSPLLVMLGFGMGRGTTASRAGALYWSIVATVGASLGAVALAYTTTSIATTFAASAAGFGALSLLAQVTRRDLGSLHSFLTTGLIGLVAALGLNLVLRSSGLGFALNCAGVLVFAGLVAYDGQRLRMFYEANRDDLSKMGAATDIGALTLYLDFINLFQFLLAFTGARR